MGNAFASNQIKPEGLRLFLTIFGLIASNSGLVVSSYLYLTIIELKKKKELTL